MKFMVLSVALVLGAGASPRIRNPLALRRRNRTSGRHPYRQPGGGAAGNPGCRRKGWRGSSWRRPGSQVAMGGVPESRSRNGGENPCHRDFGAGGLWIHLLPRTPLELPAMWPGFAVLLPPSENADSYAGVSYPAVEEMAKNLEGEPLHVLAATLVHEIGHVLLGSKSHSRVGIMNSARKTRAIGDALEGRTPVHIGTGRSAAGPAGPSRAVRGLLKVNSFR